MGHRTVKRVPLDFDAPLDKTWKGYVNPYGSGSRNCEACERTGLCPDGKFLHDSWYGHIAREMFGNFHGNSIHGIWTRERYLQAGWSEEVVANIERAKKFGFTVLAHWSDKLHPDEIATLAEEGRLWDVTHERKDGKWVKKDSYVLPTSEEMAGYMHDGINQGVCIDARAKRFGLDPENKKTWYCKECKGEGSIWSSAKAKKQCEEWESTEPPTGPGWQLWETTSEGSPTSPVFKTPGALAEWCAENATIFADQKLSKQQWLKIIREDKVEVGSLGIMGPGIGVTTIAKLEMGEPSPRDWTPDLKAEGDR
jgi:hypothetical protein